MLLSWPNRSGCRSNTRRRPARGASCPRTGRARTKRDRVAVDRNKAASDFTSRAWFFGFCVVLVVLWVPSLPLFGSLDTWQLVINTATTIITFLLVALLQNSQWRGDKATNEKLDAVAGGLAETMVSGHLLMHALHVECDDHEINRAAEQLRRSIGAEKRTSSGAANQK